MSIHNLRVYLHVNLHVNVHLHVNLRVNLHVNYMGKLPFQAFVEKGQVTFGQENWGDLT